MKETNWYTIENIEDIDSPALFVYPDRVKENIRDAIKMVAGPSVLRPHVKTSKMSEVGKLLLNHGITKFKCATIAEAEMLAMIGAGDVLLAYQPVGPKILRLLQLTRTYPSTVFSCLLDNIDNARHLNEVCAAQNSVLPVYIDLNIGMDRTGIHPEDAFDLVKAIRELPALRLVGLHGYDGQLRDTDIAERTRKSDEGFARVKMLAEKMQELTHEPPVIILGGSPSFPTHARRTGVECSPGTFVFWDWNYQNQLPDEPFRYAALVVSRIVSIIDAQTVCLDLGHKSVAAENPLPRVYFLNVPGAEPVAQSEEHLVVKVSDASLHRVGEVWYGVPVHICPTVALYEKAWVVENGRSVGEWKVTARNRYINF
ncbi:MAG TPA: D-TA family PLP-dependent enzyme [Chitinophagaceae bacterium]|jgi:D-serine deaminase-like pyridoxal phosphate-dependent protein